MSFVVKKIRSVDTDLVSAAEWYDRAQPGLGDAFLDEADIAITSLSENALLYSVRFDDVRCARLHRFHQYGVYYVIRENEVRVLAVHHGARDPEWLKEQTKSSS